MQFTPALRKLALTVHVFVSVAFPGSVACFFVLALTALGSAPASAHAAYVAMESMTYLVIVPLCLLALVSGLISSLGTPWGVLRYWWIVVKLLVTLLSTIILAVHLQPISRMAQSGPDAHTTTTQIQLVLASGIALAALVVLTALSIYKPRGLTGRGDRLLAR